ncbi:glycosyltransferase family 8 protein [uncultured Sphaerochaeta sp.]|uniref:glycosyltransferase family 8 protein n=1 Tax=uncultured Sphaerochaeta sp. TaxID=886478 RepID=UPI002A0A5337|nr:glycosyltransferase family 8 protein [uncultured Sphaerochaeta sp.]
MASITFLELNCKNSLFAPASVFVPFLQDLETSAYSPFFSMIRRAWKHNNLDFVGFFKEDEYLSSAPSRFPSQPSGIIHESYLSPAFPKAIPVVFASNERFAPSLGVCLQSMLEHCSNDRFYDVVILESNLLEDSKQRLARLVKGMANVSLRFFNPTEIISQYSLKKNPTDHISLETYYRFLIPDILPSYGKVLYLDCDTVINDDVAFLFETDLQGKTFAAALDAEIAGLRHGGDSLLVSYMQSVLGMGADDPYFQVGVLVLDLERMKRTHSVKQWLTIASERKYRFNDQDILNKECKGNILQLDTVWNVVVDCGGRRLPLIMKAPAEISQAYLQAREHPALIHYAGFLKPWNDSSSDFAYVFWDYAKRSTFYDRLLLLEKQAQEGKDHKSLSEYLFPRGSKRRQFMKKIYLRMMQ